MIYLKHPVHGTKVAIAEAEAQYDESNGWSRYILDSISQVISETETTIESPGSKLSQSKYGRRPIKLDSDETPSFLTNS